MKNPPEVIGKDALVGFIERGNSLDLLDLEVSLAVLPVADRYLKRIMEVRGRAAFIVAESLKADGARQRLHGSTTFGLKDGTWTMAEWEAIALLDFLLTYVGKDFAQGDLDKALRFETVITHGRCPDHGDYDVTVACPSSAADLGLAGRGAAIVPWEGDGPGPRCGQVTQTLVVNHTGINAIEKSGSAAVKEAIGKYRRRSEPTLTMKTSE